MPKKGPSKNMARLNEDMRRELIGIIGAMKDPRLKTGLVTITRVEVTSDFSQARVHVSVLDQKDGGGKAVAGVVEALRAAKGHVRSEIAARMHIRKTPEFVFVADEGAAYAAHINALLRDLKT